MADVRLSNSSPPTIFMADSGLSQDMFADFQR